MTRAQWSILFWLERRPGLSQKELAEILDVEPITVARLIDRLETHGAVERAARPERSAHLGGCICVRRRNPCCARWTAIAPISPAC